jgi:large subunit ribosomal protein L22
MQTAVARQTFILMSHRKLRRVANEIRGKQVMEAFNILSLMPYRAAKVLLKKLIEATSNAHVLYEVKPNELIIDQVLIDEGPAYRRFKPRAQGRIYRREKPTAHVTLRVKVKQTA